MTTRSSKRVKISQQERAKLFSPGDLVKFQDEDEEDVTLGILVSVFPSDENLLKRFRLEQPDRSEEESGRFLRNAGRFGRILIILGAGAGPYLMSTPLRDIVVVVKRQS